jgi:hypothetical protein
MIFYLVKVSCYKGDLPQDKLLDENLDNFIKFLTNRIKKQCLRGIFFNP